MTASLSVISPTAMGNSVLRRRLIQSDADHLA